MGRGEQRIQKALEDTKHLDVLANPELISRAEPLILAICFGVIADQLEELIDMVDSIPDRLAVLIKDQKDPPEPKEPWEDK